MPVAAAVPRVPEAVKIPKLQVGRPQSIREVVLHGGVVLSRLADQDCRCLRVRAPRYSHNMSEFHLRTIQVAHHQPMLGPINGDNFWVVWGNIY